MQIEDLTIVVCCNKKDFFLARICIASIRYYYPSIAIELIKDPGNGDFSSLEVEKYFNVKVVDLKITKMGWSGAKFHYLYQSEKGRKILILDADIVFIAPFLERMLPVIESNDYVVSIEAATIPDKEWAENTYFDIQAVQKAYPDYKYPGFFFNAGQIFLTTGSVEEEQLNRFFDRRKYPFWQNCELFPMVDQSVYNYLLPSLNDKKMLKLGKEQFMVWAASQATANIQLDKVSSKCLQTGLIHWAGCLRTGYIKKMLMSDILHFFEDYYYTKVPFGKGLKRLRKIKPVLKYYSKKYYNKIKQLI
jgi:hypothetical protein